MDETYDGIIENGFLKGEQITCIVYFGESKINAGKKL
jgi:hypothetical protein